jgi:hypothetical protein
MTIKRTLITLIAMTPSLLSALGYEALGATWLRRAKPEKEVLLQGYCEGLSTFSDKDSIKLGIPFCVEPGAGRRTEVRFCGAALTDPAKAIAYVDAFYRNPDQTDIPMWAVVANYNDKACGETTVKGILPKLQARGECTRKLGALLDARVSSAVLNAQREECERLR